MTKEKLKDKLCVWKKITEDSGREYNEGNLRHCYWYCDGLQTDCKDYEAIENGGQDES